VNERERERGWLSKGGGESGRSEISVSLWVEEGTASAAANVSSIQIGALARLALCGERQANRLDFRIRLPSSILAVT